MRLTKIKTIYQLTFLARLFPINCYLVEEETSLTLIDTGIGFGVKDILNASETIGKPLTKIILTHPHGDHIGGLDQLKEALPQAIIYSSKRDARLMAGDLSLETDEPQTPIKGSFAKNLKTTPDKLLTENDFVGSLKAIDAPGHTPGSMAFYDERSNILIAGDAFHSRPTLTVTGDLRLLFPFPAMATWNKSIAIQTAKKLNTYECYALAVGHGPVCYNPKEAINHAIKRAEAHLGKD